MNECINRNSIYNKLQALFNYWLNSIESQTISISYAKQKILPMIMEELPASDVAPVVHGRWVEYQIPPIICCSNCDWATSIEEKNFQHCPNCGAKMDEEE